jgi:hypothetical protein
VIVSANSLMLLVSFADRDEVQLMLSTHLIVSFLPLWNFALVWEVVLELIWMRPECFESSQRSPAHVSCCWRTKLDI